MSTRSTLWYSEDLHLYREGFDDEHVYLEIRSPQFEELVLKIPLTAWKEMRKHTIEPNERYLDMTDEELAAEAQQQVDKHRERLEEISRAQPRQAAFLRTMGSFVFGAPESTRDEMIESFLRFYRRDQASTS